MMKYNLLYTLLIAGLLAWAGCGKNDPHLPVSLSGESIPSEPESHAVPADAVRVGIAAMISPEESYRYYEDLLSFVSLSWEAPTVTTQGSYEEINELLHDGALDLAFVCSGPYVAGRRDFNLKLLVVPVVKGKTTYNSYIIVNRDSGIKDFRALKGKRFAFTDKLSLSGYLYPASHLKSMGTTPDAFFSKVIFSNSHDGSILAVAKGLVDAAAVDSLIWDYLAETNPVLTNKTNIIRTSPDFGIPPVVVPAGLGQERYNRLQTAFLTLHEKEKGRAILSKLRIDRFLKADDSLFKNVRELMERLK